MKCATCTCTGNTVSYKGDITSPFVIITEGPSLMDVTSSKPFNGPGTKLLDSVLAPFKRLFKVEPLIIHAFNCLPKTKTDSTTKAAVRACSERVRAELALHPRKVILTLGNAAIWSITGNYDLKVTQIRGKRLPTTLSEHGIIPTVHPNFLLRGSGNLIQFQRDIQLAIEYLVGKEAFEAEQKSKITSSDQMQFSGTFKAGSYKVLDQAHQVVTLAGILKAGEIKYVAADIETEGLNPRRKELDKVEFTGKGILCLAISWGHNETFIIPGHLIIDELFQNDVKWCWHNGKFDIGWLRHYGFKSVRVDDDTMLLSYILNERGGIHDLEQVGADWLQAPDYKNVLKPYLPSRRHSYAHIPTDVLYKYAATDVELTYCLRNLLRAKVAADSKLLQAYEKVLIPASEFLHRVEAYGFLTDKDKVAENELKLREQADVYEKAFLAEAKKYGYHEMNIRSPLQVSSFLYGTLKLAPVGTSTDADELQKLWEKHPHVTALNDLLGYRGVHKQLSTFVAPMREKADPVSGRIHTTFKLHGTTTGRLSSNKPNLQNIPREKYIRHQFVAAPGRVILDTDLSQAELRMLACLSGDPVFCDTFNRGISPHDVTCMKLYGSIDKEKKIVAKCVNFGIIYGISASGIVGKLEVEPGITQVPTRAEAQKWIDGWATGYPVAWDYIQRCRMAPPKGQTLISFTGRKRRFGVVSRESLNHLQNEAANFPHQSGAHDITLLAGIQVQDTFAKDYDAYFVNEVHDALLAEIPDDLSIIIPAARLLCSTMQEVPRDWGLTKVPFLAEAQVGPAWENALKFDPFDEKFNDLTAWKGKSYAELQ